LFDDGEKATQIIRQCFVAADFTEEVLVRTPRGLFAVGTHAFRGVRRPLPVNKTLFEFTGFASIPSAVSPPHQQRPSPASLHADEFGGRRL
jgi:hypothetical protein